MKKKTIAILMAAMLVCGGVAGATVAWLTDSTVTIRNTFTAGDVEIELTEKNPSGEGNVRYAKMIPGSEIIKDPQVTVKAGSEPCYLFVKIEPSDNYSTFFGAFTAENVRIGEDEWQALSVNGVTNVYYRIVNPNNGQPLSANEDFYVLKDNKVQVLDTVTKANMESIKAPNSQPTLTFTAYAVQLENIFSPADAWAQISTTESPTQPST